VIKPTVQVSSGPKLTQNVALNVHTNNGWNQYRREEEECMRKRAGVESVVKA